MNTVRVGMLWVVVALSGAWQTQPQPRTASTDKERLIGAWHLAS